VKTTAGERFEGFADADAKFFKALARNQNKEWFQKHKAEFTEGYAGPMKLLLEELRERIDGLYPHVDLGEAKVFRIFRDVRFSKDKSPYKTHVAGYIPVKSTGGAMDAPAALYVHVGTESLAAAGHYMMDGPTLGRFRSAVADEERGAALMKILGRLEKKGFKAEAHGAYKRVPKGFDPGHPRAKVLMYKGLISTFPPFPRGVLASRKLVDWLLDGAKASAPLVEWLVFATR
jgi:uncharacterized protein (TIGR02453 family)